MEIEGIRYPFSFALYFIPEFISRMRRSPECREKPSPRQSIIMSKLMLPAYMRRGYLAFEDVVGIAVLTSKIENQGLAERIAVEVLLAASDEEKTAPEREQELMSLLSPKSDDLSSFVQSDEEGEVMPKGQPDSDVNVFREFTNKPDLGVGPGEDELLKSTIRIITNREDKLTRKRLTEFLKSVLLKLGLEGERKLENLNDPSLRPYEPFEDPERIEEERSLENIFEQGKTLDEIRHDDFLMRNRRSRKRSIAYVLDVSNTMFYSLDGINSINYSILCLVPLLYSLRREKYGVVLYESNSHILKEIDDDGDEEQLIDTLLSLVTATTSDAEESLGTTKGSHLWGGTVPTMSLRWALDQLTEAGERTEKLCFIFSDFVLEEVGGAQPEEQESYGTIERMIEQGIRVVACVSPLAHRELFEPYTMITLPRIRKVGCEMIETGRPTEFLEMVQALLSAQ